MRARLYRGPKNGKVIEVPDHYYSVQVALFNASKAFASSPLNGYPADTIRTVLYVKTRFMHPDGSVFFEWDQPRRPSRKHLR